jgi:hypothetical protein
MRLAQSVVALLAALVLISGFVAAMYVVGHPALRTCSTSNCLPIVEPSFVICGESYGTGSCGPMPIGSHP